MRSKIHILLPIALALILPSLSVYANSGMHVLQTEGVFGNWLMSSIILYFFWHGLWYIWGIESKHKVWWFALVIMIFMVIFAGALLGGSSNGIASAKWFNIIRVFLVSGLFLTIQYALKAQENIAILQLEKEQIQTENYRAQLKTLRAQIDPHFLFNSLNTLRSMVRQQHDNSEQFIMSLSQFYRQTLKHNENATLALSAELEVLQSYLFLMKSRNEEAVHVQLNIDQSLYDYQIPAMALQVVVENCFKHNSMTSRNPLKIEIGNAENKYILVKNNIQARFGDKEPSGYGLDSLRKRYELMNISDGIIVQETPDHFTVKLKLI